MKYVKKILLFITLVIGCNTVAAPVFVNTLKDTVTNTKNTVIANAKELTKNNTELGAALAITALCTVGSFTASNKITRGSLAFLALTPIFSLFMKKPFWATQFSKLPGMKQFAAFTGKAKNINIIGSLFNCENKKCLGVCSQCKSRKTLQLLPFLAAPFILKSLGEKLFGSQGVEQLRLQQAEAARVAAEQAEAERIAAEQLRLQQEAEAERVAAEQLRLQQEAEAERAAAEQLRLQQEAERAAAEQLRLQQEAEAERAAAAEQLRLQQEAEAERIAAEQLRLQQEAERAAAEQEIARIAAQKRNTQQKSRSSANKKRKRKVTKRKKLPQVLTEKQIGRRVILNKQIETYGDNLTLDPQLNGQFNDQQKALIEATDCIVKLVPNRRGGFISLCHTNKTQEFNSTKAVISHIKQQQAKQKTKETKLPLFLQNLNLFSEKEDYPSQVVQENYTDVYAQRTAKEKRDLAMKKEQEACINEIVLGGAQDDSSVNPDEVNTSPEPKPHTQVASEEQEDALQTSDIKNTAEESDSEETTSINSEDMERELDEESKDSDAHTNEIEPASIETEIVLDDAQGKKFVNPGEVNTIQEPQATEETTSFLGRVKAAGKAWRSAPFGSKTKAVVQAFQDTQNQE